MSCTYIGKAVTYKIANLHTAQLTFVDRLTGAGSLWPLNIAISDHVSCNICSESDVGRWQKPFMK